MANPRVLIVEDERAMRVVLQDSLEAADYRVIVAEDGAAALTKAREEEPDLLLLDVMLPKLDGLAVCRELRRLGSKVPILMLTAKGQLDDRVDGLDAGADDYLVKPFSGRELLARIRALLRRQERREGALQTLNLGSVTVDFVRQTATRDGAKIAMTQKELAMLRLLAEAAGKPVSRHEFLDRVWGYAAFSTTRTVDNHLAGLRKKIEPDPAQHRWLKTVHGVGYRLATDDETDAA